VPPEGRGELVLRILQQSLRDVDRLLTTLTDDKFDNTEAISILITVFFTFSCEHKIGRITDDDLRNRTQMLWMARVERNKRPEITLADVADRHPNIPLDDTILPDLVLYDTLVLGMFDANAINAGLMASVYYNGGMEEDHWLTLWYGFRRSDDRLVTAQAALENEFIQRKYVDPEVMLHVFGIRLWMASVNMLAFTIEQIVQQCKLYIDDLNSQGLLRPTPIG
jgi:hypothetical protein